MVYSSKLFWLIHIVPYRTTIEDRWIIVAWRIWRGWHIWKWRVFHHRRIICSDICVTTGLIGNCIFTLWCKFAHFVTIFRSIKRFKIFHKLFEYTNDRFYNLMIVRWCNWDGMRLPLVLPGIKTTIMFNNESKATDGYLFGLAIITSHCYNLFPSFIKNQTGLPFYILNAVLCYRFKSDNAWRTFHIIKENFERILFQPSRMRWSLMILR